MDHPTNMDHALILALLSAGCRIRECEGRDDRLIPVSTGRQSNHIIALVRLDDVLDLAALGLVRRAHSSPAYREFVLTDHEAGDAARDYMAHLFATRREPWGLTAKSPRVHPLADARVAQR